MADQQARAAARALGKAWEERQSGLQRWLNQFSENWIFAFVIAMAIRGLLLEAYRIPTASMEPMMYGDQAIMKADHVVVDRVSHKFSLPDRWDVTVFHYPRPEMMQNGQIVPADISGERRDTLFNQVHRNFVKRCVVLPGDVFYIANGDLFLQQEDGRFSVVTKPPAIQEALWMPIYQHGDQADYLPWENAQGAAPALDTTGAVLVAGELHFTQPLCNLYLKPGPYRIAPRIDALRARRSGHLVPHQQRSSFGQVKEVTLTQPLFDYARADGSSIRGSIWDLQTWEIARLTTADLDAGHYGTILNSVMDEQIGDVRVRFQVDAADAPVQLLLSEGEVQTLTLDLGSSGWQLHLTGHEAPLATGDAAREGATWALVHVDDHVWVTRDGQALCAPIATAAVDPQEHPTHLRFRCAGQASLRAIDIARDVHYCADGFLQDERAKSSRFDYEYALDYEQMRRALMQGRVSGVEEARQQAVLQAYERQLAAYEYSLHGAHWVREQMLGKPLAPSATEARQAIGIDPESAITAPENGYLLLGDNSPLSLDSRRWGWVPETNLRGQVLGVVFPRLKFVR